jgi:hypothetical protein
VSTVNCDITSFYQRIKFNVRKCFSGRKLISLCLILSSALGTWCDAESRQVHTIHLACDSSACILIVYAAIARPICNESHLNLTFSPLPILCLFVYKQTYVCVCVEEGRNERIWVTEKNVRPSDVCPWVRCTTIWLTSHRLWVTTAGNLSTVLRWREKCFVALFYERLIKRHSGIDSWIIYFMLCASLSACPCQISFIFPSFFSSFIYLFISLLLWCCCCKLGPAGCDISSLTRSPPSSKPCWNPVVIWRL